MTTEQTIEIDAITGEITTREMTASEIEQRKLDKIAATLRTKADADKATNRAALLDKLGITADEASLLLG